MARGSVWGALTSRLGRRFMVLFALCALLPMIVFATLAVTRVTRQLRQDLYAGLHNDAKTAGMGLMTRLNQIAADLALAAELVQRWRTEGAWSDGSALSRQVADRCSGMWLHEGTTATRLCGAGEAPLVELGDGEREHLARGQPLVRVIDKDRILTMTLAIEPSDPESPLVMAAVRQDWIWKAQELKGASCHFTACDANHRLLFYTSQQSPPVARLAACMARQTSSGSFDWQVDGELHLARYWRVFLLPQYDFDLTVVQSRPAQEALKVERSFFSWFLLTAFLTLLVVIFVSLVQMRRTLDPIVSMHDATQRLGRGDLDVRVFIDCEDELGELGAAFNDMAYGLQENIMRREKTERELVASRDAALAAAKAKAEFVTNVSHEFRTPMAEILGAAEILTQLGDDDHDAREEFSAIALHGAQRLAGLLDDVLKLGRTTTGIKSSVDIGASLRAAVDRMAEETRGRIRLAVDMDVPCVCADRDQIVDAWHRLLDNAVKFSFDEAPVDVRALRVGKHVVVEFCDQGVGIAAEDLERVFEPFSQVGRDQMIDKANGTGLGLTLARSAIQAQGGSIEIESELGKGSIFRVQLPMDAPVEAPVDVGVPVDVEVPVDAPVEAPAAAEG